MGAAPPILVADGDRTARRAVGALLRRIGYETIEAKTGPEALELAMRLQPALVILEVNLEEVSGYEVCRELRDAFGDEISVIFLSGHRTTPSDRVAGLLVGADDYIVKPFDSDEFLARVRVGVAPWFRPARRTARMPRPLSTRPSRCASAKYFNSSRGAQIRPKSPAPS